jgi:amino acid transporter
MIAIIGFTNWGGNPMEPFTAEPVESGLDVLVYLGGGLSIGMWMYSGYESMSTIAGELEDPQVIPKATLISVPVIMATYILPTFAALSAFKGEGEGFEYFNWVSEGEGIGYTEVANHFLGPAAGIFFVVVAVVAMCSIFNTYIASGSRGFFTLSEDKLIPKMFSKVGKKNGVPYVSVLSIGLASLILCNLKFKNLIVIDVFLLVSSYILVFVSAMILRKRIPKEEYKFRVPGPNIVMNIICIVPIIVAIFSFFVNGSDYFIGGIIGLVSGPILYFFWKRHYGGLQVLPGGLNPQNPKTRLAVGDVNRMALIFAILAVIGLIGTFFLPFYEVTLGGWEFPADYDMTIMGSQEAMWFGIKIATAVSAVLAVVLWLVAKKVEVKKAA